MRSTVLYISSFFLITISVAQDTFSARERYDNSNAPEKVVDEQYGITMYEPLNMMLGSDTLRNDDKGYALNGYKEDFYSTGQRLHKGFYLDGQLKIYKNFYPNGQVERNFRMVDLKKSKMTLFYKDGKMKSNITYIGSEPLKWEDYYPNGKLEFVEEFHKSFLYYVFKANYYENGTPENTLELTNKKKLIYTQSYYYDNGKPKETGEMKYDRAMFDYKRIGTWKKYDESGVPIKEVKYASGKVILEKDL